MRLASVLPSLTRALLAMLAAMPALTAGCKRRSEPPVGPPAQAAPRVPPAPPDAAEARADWDPPALVKAGADPVQLFINAPRDPAWARTAEEVLGAQMRRDLGALVPAARGIGIECRTLACVIQADAPAAHLALATEVIKLVMLGPYMADLGTTPDGKAQVLFLTDPRMRDPAVFAAWYRRTHRQTIERIRAGLAPNPFPLDRTKLPVE